MFEPSGVSVVAGSVLDGFQLYGLYLLFHGRHPLKRIYPQLLDVRNFPQKFNFSKVNYIYNKHYTDNNDNINYMNMKRTYRNDMPQTQKDKIAQANTGKVLSPETRRRISQSMVKYWAGLPFKPATSGTTEPATGTTGTTTYYTE